MCRSKCAKGREAERWLFAGSGYRPVTDRVWVNIGRGSRSRRRVEIGPRARLLDGRLRPTAGKLVQHPAIQKNWARRGPIGEVPREHASNELLTGGRRSSYHQPLHLQSLLLLDDTLRALDTRQITSFNTAIWRHVRQMWQIIEHAEILICNFQWD